MCDFIINAPSLQGPTIPAWVLLFGGLPINSPLVGSFLGVILAFALNYIYRFVQDYKSKMYYKNSIKLEIELCIKRSGTLGDLLPTDRWTATLNSGALRLFSVGEADELSRAYEAIRNYNYEAQRARDLGEDYRRYSVIFGGPDEEEGREFKSRWEQGSARLEGIRIELQKILGKSMEYMAKSWWQFWK